MAAVGWGWPEADNLTWWALLVGTFGLLVVLFALGSYLERQSRRNRRL